MIDRPIGNETGVSFGDLHSWFDWGLRLADVSIGLPEPHTTCIEVPGRNGTLDLTESMNGSVSYGNRTLVFTFDTFASYRKWSWVLSEVSKAVHGKKLRIVSDTDPDFYYIGRCSVGTEKGDSVLSSIVITCDCEPFKRPLSSLDEFADMEINSPSGWFEIIVLGWPFNEALEITCSADMVLKYSGVEYALGRGLNIMTQFSLSEGENALFFKGTGTVTITQRGGML